MDNMYVDVGGILVPRHLAPATMKTREYIPLSFLQLVLNRIFYKMDEPPLSFISTLGWYDPLLPSAKAVDFLKDSPDIAVIHEIGPGNFNFAKVFVDKVRPRLENIVYQTYDFSDSCYVFVKEELKPYQDVIKFSKESISEFPDKVEDDPLNVVLVEVLDDILTEFFTMHEGKEYMLSIKPGIERSLTFPGRAMAGKLRILGGEFSLATKRMASRVGLKDKYTAQDIINIMDSNQWGSLDDIYPSFLGFLRYEDKEYVPMPVGSAYRYHWQNMPNSFKDFGDAVLAFYREQLKRVEDARTTEAVAVSIPIAGLTFLWRVKDRKKVHIDFFDYGYDLVEKKIMAFSTHTGQITAPVNFEIIKYAAEWLGFNTLLEKDSDFIKRNLGEDTIRLGYAMKALKNYTSISFDRLKKFMYGMFHKAVKDLCPISNCTVDNIFGFRVRRSDYGVFLKAGMEAGYINQGAEVNEGSYHLAVFK